MTWEFHLVALTFFLVSKITRKKQYSISVSAKKVETGKEKRLQSFNAIKCIMNCLQYINSTECKSRIPKEWTLGLINHINTDWTDNKNFWEIFAQPRNGTNDPRITKLVPYLPTGGPHSILGLKVLIFPTANVYVNMVKLLLVFC